MLESDGVVWITGGSSGIGLAIARELSKTRGRIAISARNLSNLDQARDSIRRETGVVVFVAQCDVTRSEEVSRCSSEIRAQFGAEISVLVNGAGLSPFSTFSETSIEEFDRVLEVNLKGAYLCVKAVLPAMYAAGRGTIIQILSVASEKAYKDGAAYVASKFALRGFTDSLREEARKFGVRVIAILPGATETELWSAEERVKFHERMMQPLDIARMIVAALGEPERALVEEIRMRPIGGDL